MATGRFLTRVPVFEALPLLYSSLLYMLLNDDDLRSLLLAAGPSVTDFCCFPDIAMVTRGSSEAAVSAGLSMSSLNENLRPIAARDLAVTVVEEAAVDLVDTGSLTVTLGIQFAYRSPH